MVQTCHAGTLSWLSLVEMGLAHNALWDFADAIHLLFTDSGAENQSSQSMLTVLEELIGITFYQPPAPLGSHAGAPCQRRVFFCLSTVSFPPSVTPQQWHVENVARLLLLCKSSLCYTFLANKANSGRLPEVSRLLVHIVLVSVLRPINHHSG